MIKEHDRVSLMCRCRAKMKMIGGALAQGNGFERTVEISSSRPASELSWKFL